MSSCSRCNPAGCDDAAASGVVLLRKLNSMISDNYVLLFVYFLVIALCTLALTYFIMSLKNTINSYMKAKATEVKITNNQKSGTDDNYTYPEEGEVLIDEDADKPLMIRDAMEKPTKDFITNLDTAYKEYNTLKSEYIKNTYEGRENDDVVDERVRFAEHDSYTY